MIRTWIALQLALVLLVSASLPAFAAEETDPAIGRGIELTPETAAEFLDAFFQSPEVQAQHVGSIVSIVHDGKQIAGNGIGYADVEQEKEVAFDETVFRVASVSKTFVAVAIMQLVEQGMVDLDGDILMYLPELEFSNPYETPVTIAHLLTHRSGFEVRDPATDDYYFDNDMHYGMEAYIEANMPDVVREPGRAYMYDNFAYLLLGMIVQNVSGQPFAQYMEEHIFKPLGMDNSSFVMDERMLEQLATGYNAVNEPVGYYMLKPTILPYGGMLTTGEDMSRFMLAMLNGGKHPSGERMLSEQSVSTMFTYQSEIHPLLPDTTYGFEAAFQIPGAGSSASIVTKAGDLPGFSSYLVLLPDEKTGLFVSTNKNNTLRVGLYEQFIHTFYPEYADTVEPEAASDGTSAASAVESIPGIYMDLRLRSIVTTVESGEDGQLMISDAFLGPRPLIQVTDLLYTDEMTGQFTAFAVDEDSGNVYMKEPYLNPFGYEQRAEEAQGFADVPDHHPYAAYIFPLQSIGLYSNDESVSFEPETEMTRAEFVQLVLETSGLSGSPTEEYAFNDIAGHEHAAFIQRAAEVGMIVGDGAGRFEPDRLITRQEAAVMLWAMTGSIYPDEWFAAVDIAGDPSPWAVPAIKMMVAFGLYGPEVEVREGEAVNYLPRQVLTRQEAAAILWQSFVQPANLIASELAAQMMESQEEAAQAETDEATVE